MEVLQFVFQDFWHWLGSFLLLGVIANIPTGLIKINVNKQDGKVPRP